MKTGESATRATTRDRLAAASLWLPVVILSVTATLWSRRLPAELPVEWLGNEGGAFRSTAVFSGITGTFALFAAVAGIIALAGVAATIRPWLVLVAGMVGGSATAAWLVAAGFGLAGEPMPASAVPWMVALVLAAASYGVVPYLLSSRQRRVRLGDAAAGVPLGVGEAGAWFTTIRVRVFGVFAAVSTLAAAVIAVLLVPRDAVGASAAIVALLLVAAGFLVFSRLRVSVDHRGLRVVSSLFRFPIAHVELNRIVSARSAELRAAEWGGWGYRVMPGRTAIVVSGRRGILVERDNGTHFAVTVPNPDLPVALLTTLVSR
ncbi:hypothetical protein K2F54_12235 [Cryobacterium sp. 1639]|uniref:hypothetical protein n=1 Tax=Cryobacterium inferilacus TaxID=2866629 RepID=UPI001C72BC09|nr:hypothetical protein [Cryobacterium sp. 1639]MBX0300741.1 hypothetical protein [Cryobacterium sp. 1639]